MPTNVIMPQMGESIFEGTLTKWLKKPGDKVQRDEPLFEISTDKVDAEIPSPAAGVLGKVLVNEGQTVQINTVVAEIDEEGAPARPAEAPKAAPAPPPSAPAPAQAASKPQAAPPQPAPSQPETQPLPGAEEPAAISSAQFPDRDAEVDEVGPGGVRTSPLVRRLAAEHGVNLAEVPGTGLGGRITKNDILGYVEAKKRGEAPPSPAAPPAAARPMPSPPPHPAQPAAQPAAQPRPSPPPRQPSAPAAPAQAAPKPAGPTAMPSPAAPAAGAPGPVEVVAMSVMRQRIAQHMVESKHTSAHVHTVHQIDMTGIVKLREEQKGEFEKRNGVKLTYMPFICRAAISALKAFPIVNASVDGNNIVYRKYINLGIAVALDWGLIVPVIKNADEKSFLGLARAIKDLADRARSKKLLPDEVQGGTFTITNPGQTGELFGMPVINQPQVGILGMGAIMKIPAIVNDAIAIRSVIHLSLGFDHRIVDGWDAGQFMSHMRGVLENWEESIL